MYNHEPAGYRCPFCLIAGGGEDEINKQDDVVLQTGDALAFVSLKWWKHNPGHVLVIPHKHIENVYDMPDELLGEVYAMGKKVALAMKEIYGCDGVSFRQHNEPAGNQSVWHFHLHVFPRWERDDLYLNHAHARYTESIERAPYAQKLRAYFERR